MSHALQAGDVSVDVPSQILGCQASFTNIPSFPEPLGLVGSGTDLLTLVTNHSLSFWSSVSAGFKKAVGRFVEKERFWVREGALYLLTPRLFKGGVESIFVMKWESRELEASGTLQSDQVLVQRP